MPERNQHDKAITQGERERDLRLDLMAEEIRTRMATPREDFVDADTAFAKRRNTLSCKPQTRRPSTRSNPSTIMPVERCYRPSFTLARVTS